MLLKVLRGFPYAADGIRIVQVDAGTDADIRDDLVPGLIAEGYVELPKAENTELPSVPEITEETGATVEQPASNDDAAGSVAEAQPASSDEGPEQIAAPAPTAEPSPSADAETETPRKSRSRR